MTKLTFNNSLTVGNLITIILIIIAAITAISQAVEHKRNDSVHLKASDVVRVEEFRQLRRDMNQGFTEIKKIQQEHYESLTNRIDRIYDKPSPTQSGRPPLSGSIASASLD